MRKLRSLIQTGGGSNLLIKLFKCWAEEKGGQGSVCMEQCEMRSGRKAVLHANRAMGVVNVDDFSSYLWKTMTNFCHSWNTYSASHRKWT